MECDPQEYHIGGPDKGLSSVVEQGVIAHSGIDVSMSVTYDHSVLRIVLRRILEVFP